MSRRTGGTSTLYESRDSSEQSDVDFAKRPQNGVNGHVIDVTANCCRIEFADKVVGRQLYKYAVEMRINGKQFTSPSILRRIFWKVVDKHRNVFPGYGIVFNDRDSLFSLRSIPVNKLELHFGRDDTSTITLELKNEILFEVGREYGELQVAFLNALLTQAERCSIGSTADSARAGSSSTSVSVQGEPQKIFVVRDNLFFVPGNGVEASYIGRGLEMWYALHSLVSLGERSEAIVNYDKKCGVFLKMKMPILEYYVCFVNGRRRLEPQDYERLRSKSLNARQRSELKDSLKGLSFIATYGAKMHYKFYDMLETGARTTFFEWENREDGIKERISVAHYFQKHWDIQLQLPDFPLIQVAPHTKRIYIPMELLMISDRPQRFRKPLPDDCMAEALKVATITPRERFLTIQRLMEKIQINEKSRFMEKFGVAVDKRMIRTDARVLPLPVLTVMDGQEQFKPDPRASWKLDKVQSNGDQKTVIGVIVDNEIRDSMGAQFVNHFNVLVTACREIGVQFVDEGYFEPCSTFFLKSREDIERKVEDLLGILRREYRDIGYYKILILFVTSERNDLNYGDLKATCELQYRVCSQVVLEKTFRKIIDKRSNPRTVGLLPSATARNIALKINVKLGGVTTAALPRQLEWDTFTSSKEPTLFLGIDVSYCRTEGEMSLFAVSGSVNLEATLYQTTITPIGPACGYTDSSLDLRVSLETSLKRFYQSTQLYPAHIVIYRMGCTRSQMSAAANRELKSVFATIKDMAELADQGRFDPTITYIHIERNHQMRFKVDERLQMPRGFASSSNGNVPAGTVVEKVITSAKVYDFYLCSHYGALGTSRPTRYIVYFDDWMLTADQIQHASFCLCFLTSNCTKAVSIPAPAYYANKGCERGRKYINSCQLKREMLHPYEPLPIPNPVSTTMYMV